MIPEATVRRAIALIKRPAGYDYFFDKLGSPDWIEPLRKAGLFARPNAPIQCDDGDYFSQRAASQYLVRMAARAPEVVTQTFENMEVGDNSSVHRDIVAAALKMPSSHAVRLAKIETDWLRSQERVFSLAARDYSKLLLKLADDGKTKAALRLIRVLFEVLPDPQRPGSARGEPSSRIHWHEYKYVLQEVLPKLPELILDELLPVLCDLLESAVKAYCYANDRSPPRDLSAIWRPTVEDDEHDRPRALAEVLTSAVRDVAVRIAAVNSEQRALVVESLEQQPWHIFHRIAMHVLCVGGTPALDVARDRIVDRQNFDCHVYQHEYVRLLRTFFSHLGEQDQNEILGWIDEGPSDLAEVGGHEPGKVSDEQEQQARSDYWKYGRIHPFYESLPESWKRRYAEWTKQFGEPRSADFARYPQCRWGNSSPKTSEELGQFEITELVTFLNSWKPSNGWDEPTVHGLATELERTAAANAIRFAENAAAFEQLLPEYVQPIVDGLREAVRSGTSLSWAPILDICEWVTRQPLDVAGRAGHRYHPLEPPPGWKWVRAAIASLIEQGLLPVEGGIPFELRDKVWVILGAIVDDPEPMRQDEAEGAAIDDPFTTSLNTTRGKAMHAVIRYAIWVARQLPRPRENELRLAQGMAEIEEVRELLERHLDPSHDASLAIRSVLGHYYPLLAAIDPDWASGCRGQIFPPAESDGPFWTAAWNAYVRFNAVYTTVFQLLAEEYTRAILRCGDYPVESRDLADAKEGLAEHTMILFGRGTVDLDPNGLVARFFSTVPLGLQVHAIDFVGRSLRHEQAQPTEVIERFKLLWTWLVKVARSASGDSDERRRLTAFRSWFTSRQFDASWSLAALEDSLRLTGRAKNSHFVIEVLAELASQFPSQVVPCLRAIICSDKEGWEISASQDEIRSILKGALSQPDPGMRAEAKDIVDELGRRGFFTVRDLLRNVDTEPL